MKEEKNKQVDSTGKLITVAFRTCNLASAEKNANLGCLENPLPKVVKNRLMHFRFDQSTLLLHVI